MNPARIVLAFALLALSVSARADTVASLLGNFTINQWSGMSIAERRIEVRHTIVFGQLPALRELHQADTDGDGVTSEVERDTHAHALAASIADHLRVVIDGERIDLRPTRVATSLPSEQGGFSFRVDVDLAGDLGRRSASPRHEVSFRNDNYEGRFGWQEIVVDAAPGVAVFDTDAFSTSLTKALTETPADLPPAGPLAERAVHFAYRMGAVPEGAQAIAPRAGTVAPAQAAAAESNWLVRQTRGIVDAISAADASPRVMLWALLAAMVLGALHAFAPGHGKTVVGAYLIGSRASARHAAFLGLTVTVTHTLGVFALGFATLFASAYVLPERVFPILGVVSGLLVLGMGVVLVVQRWPAARAAWARKAAFRPLAVKPGAMFAMANGASASGGWHSHGGTWHTHTPPDAVTWKSLLALGISGGLVPCPSAMVLLLAAVALNKTAFGLLLVVAFSLGLALTLTAIGFLFLFARNRLPGGAGTSRWTRVVPLASAAFITLIGVALCLGAVTGVAI